LKTRGLNPLPVNVRGRTPYGWPTLKRSVRWAPQAQGDLVSRRVIPALRAHTGRLHLGLTAKVGYPVPLFGWVPHTVFDKKLCG
jgi:hypothetical protein